MHRIPARILRSNQTLIIHLGRSFRLLNAVLLTRSSLSTSTVEPHHVPREHHDAWPSDISLYDLVGSQCSGCGAAFQISDPNVAGFVTPELVSNYHAKLAQVPDSAPMTPEQLEQKVSAEVIDWKYISTTQRKKHLRKARHTADPKLVAQLTCQRCHDIVRENSTRVAGPRKVTPSEIAHATKSQRTLVIQVVDLIDFPLSHFDIRPAVAKGHPYLLVFNKADLLPVSASRDRLLQWSTHFVNRLRIHRPAGIHIVSSKSGDGMAKLMTHVTEIQARFSLRHVHLVGCTNAGKSEFINCLHRMVRFPKTVGKLTASRLPGTTVANLPVPLKRFSGLLRSPEPTAGNLFMHREMQKRLGNLTDTPGVSLTSRLTELLPGRDLKRVHWRKRLVPVTYRVPPGKSMFLGGLGRLDYVSGPTKRIHLTVWASNTLPVHVTSTQKADQFCGVTSPTGIIQPPSTDACSPTVQEVDMPPTPDSSVRVIQLAPPLTFDRLNTPAQAEEEKEEEEVRVETRCVEETHGPRMDPTLLPEILSPPSVDARTLFPQWAVAGEYVVPGFGVERAWCDFVVGGVGFVSVSGDFEEATFRVWTPGGVGAVMRDALMPYDFGDKKIRIE